MKKKSVPIKSAPDLKTKKLSKSKIISINSDVTDAHTDYSQSLSKRAFFKTNDLGVSQDLVQTTFLKTLLYLRKGGKIETMRHFLNHILNDLIVDEYRKRRTTSLDSLLENGFEMGFDDNQQMIDRLDGKKIILLIPLLPEKYQVVMHMRYVQNLTDKEISVLTNQLPNTVAVQAHRGLAKIKILYAEAQV